MSAPKAARHMRRCDLAPPSPPSLIPVLVTGIQRAQVLGRERIPSGDRVIHRADARWLDSCHRDRNEGEDVVSVRVPIEAGRTAGGETKHAVLAGRRHRRPVSKAAREEAARHMRRCDLAPSSLLSSFPCSSQESSAPKPFGARDSSSSHSPRRRTVAGLLSQGQE
jgi:hypothetical protein